MSKRGRQQGELEQLVLDALWNSSGPLTSQQILEEIAPKSDLALTTVLTVLSRLIEKEIVERQPGEGRSLLFSAVHTREQNAAEVMLQMISEAGNPALAFSHFANGLSKKDLAALRKSLEK